MAWQIAWNGTTWNLTDAECPDSIDSRPVAAGGSVRRRYDGVTSAYERWRAQAIQLGWTGIGAALYGTLSNLVAYTGTVTLTTSDLAVGTQTGRIPVDSIRGKSYGYQSFDIGFTLECDP